MAVKIQLITAVRPGRRLLNRRNGLTFGGKMIKSNGYPAPAELPSGGAMAPHSNDAAAWVSTFRRNIDDMLNIIYHMRENGGCLHEFSPLMDIFETAGHFVIELDLPGFAESDFSTTVDGQSIRVEGVKRHARAETDMSYICLERHFGRFNRTIDIPPDFDPAGMQTVYHRGVLSITLPRR
jgi:HSP20 family protein